ncbi:MAG: hypothetical protein GXY83_34595 [Rhodopirellula sp.]|nr:hypothetical protein [Rhodopirellula sp.]
MRCQLLGPISALVLTAGLSRAACAAPLPGTEPLVMPQDVVARHLEQVTGYFLRRIEQAKPSAKAAGRSPAARRRNSRRSSRRCLKSTADWLA